MDYWQHCCVIGTSSKTGFRFEKEDKLKSLFEIRNDWIFIEKNNSTNTEWGKEGFIKGVQISDSDSFFMWYFLFGIFFRLILYNVFTDVHRLLSTYLDGWINNKGHVIYISKVRKVNELFVFCSWLRPQNSTIFLEALLALYFQGAI